MRDNGEPLLSIVVVADHDATTITDCLDAVGSQIAEAGFTGRVDVVVADLDSGDEGADVAIHHPLPVRVLVVPPAGLDLVLRAARPGLRTSTVVLLRADHRPGEGWLCGALDASRDHDFAMRPDTGHATVVVNTRRLGQVRLFDSPNDPLEASRRACAAGGRVSPSVNLPVEPARAAAPVPSPLPPLGRPPRRRVADGRITVAICTRNRSQELERCLRSVAALDDASHEILVIDNNERPTIREEALPVHARIVHEPRRGLDVARNRALHEATGEIVAFVDDDCEVDPHWLTALRVAFADPGIAAVTGRVRPASLRTRSQRWFECHFSFDRGLVRQRFTPWDDRPWYPMWAGLIGTGCNMAFRAEDLRALGAFDELLDMGTAIGGGGDLDVFIRFMDVGALIEYAPDALVWHHHRATTRQLVRQFWGYGMALGALVTKSVLERPRTRLAAIRFFVDRLGHGLRIAQRRRAGAHLLPLPLLAVEVAGRFAGLIVYAGSRWKAQRRGR